MTSARTSHLTLLFMVAIVFCWSGWRPHDRFTWWMAIITGSAANDFIGNQGDVWDTQADVLLALIGAVCALLLLSHFHDHALQNIDPRKGPSE